MGILNIREAEREGARLVIGLIGTSGSGKTYSALQLAYGMANGNARKVGLLDTENKRGSLYADSIKNSAGEIQRFMIADMYAPFSPARYSQAIKEFQQAGVEVLVIDSASHEWEGEGGCEDIADDGGKVANWKKAKREHKRFMNTLLTCDMHIIVCLRAREKTSFSNPKAPVSLGLQPICEKNVPFELTVSLMMHDQGKRQDVLKCPADLQGIVGRGEGYLTPKDGLNLRKWVDGAKQLDPNIERAKNTILSLTGDGLAAVNEYWQTLDVPSKKALGQQFIDMARDSAKAFDDSKAERDRVESEDLGLASGDFNPLAGREYETVSAPHREEPPIHEGDPFDVE